jgi:hypothetical protein
MNTQEEIRQAIDDYRQSRIGKITLNKRIKTRGLGYVTNNYRGCQVGVMFDREN